MEFTSTFKEMRTNLSFNLVDVSNQIIILKLCSMHFALSLIKRGYFVLKERRKVEEKLVGKG